MASTALVKTSCAPSLQNLVDQESLKWIFVGGKGGVGKTTTSCCLGVKLAESRRNVLIVSTDPAHNLSDAFNQKFSRTPTLVEGYTNLYCMEIDPSSIASEEVAAPELQGEGGAQFGAISNLLKDFSGSIPGVDEVLSFAELMKHVQRMEFDVTVFDTAPTGHTLRLLALPGMLDKALSKLMGLREKFGGALSSLQSMMGNAANGMPSEAELMGKIDELKSVVDAVQNRIHNADETTFVCVCIPEFLSLYETERLVQELTKFEIDTHNIVVNQVLYPTECSTCSRCQARMRMQGKYLSQIEDLYEDFHVTTTPLLNEEVRGTPKLNAFGEFLLAPYDPVKPLPAVLEASAAE